LAPLGVPWSFYLVSKSGLWILYTLALALAALIIARRAPGYFSNADQTDRTPEMILTCAALYFSFVLFFFGNASSWEYYFFIVVLGLTAVARLGIRWEVLVGCLAFAIPITKVNKTIVQRLAPDHREASASNESSAPSLAAPVSPIETGFGYKLWSTTSPSPETAGLWATPVERGEWIKVLAMIKGHNPSMLEYYGCANLLSTEFSPPTALYLVRGDFTPIDLRRELSQLKEASMIVVPRWQGRLLDDIPEIGSLVRRDFIPVFQGNWFVVYSRRQG
jgi:hypothetical protein